MASIVPAGRLVFGMQLPVQSQSTLYAEPWESEAGAAELAAVARAADDAGFFYLAVCDHVAVPQGPAKRMGTTWYDTVATLGWLAAQTTRTRLLSHVYVPAYRHPLVAAKAFCTLDHLSGGRLVVGVGAGHVPGEFEALGLDFDRRGALLDDALDVIETALREEFPAVRNASFSLDGEVGLRPRPVQSPRPPIWVGGSSPAALRRVARKGDGWLPQGTPRAEMPALVELLHKERDAAGRADDPVDVGAVTEWLHVGTPSWDVGRRCRWGSADELAADLREYATIGVHHLQVRFPSRSVGELVEQVTAFGTEVGPLLG